MSRPGIAYNDVATAAQQLCDQAKNPTIEQIRLLLGTGSSTTIAHHLRRWKEAQINGDLRSAKDQIPLELTSAIKLVWEQLVQNAEEKILKLDVKHQDTLAELEQELQKYKNNNQRWQQMYSHWIKEKDVLSHEKLGLEQALISSQKDNTALKAQIDIQHLHLSEKEHRIDELHRLHKLAQENLEHYRESMRMQRLHDQEKYAQHLQQVELSLKNAEQQLVVVNQDKITLQQKLDKTSQENAVLQKSHDAIGHKLDKLQSLFATLEKEQSKMKFDAVHWHEQHDMLQKKSEEQNNLLAEQKKQNAVLLQQLSMVRDELKELKDQNKFLAQEKWEIAQEKAQLEGVNIQLQKMIYSNSKEFA